MLHHPSHLLIALALCVSAPASLCAQNGPALIVQPGAPGQPSKVLPPETTGTVTTISSADVAFMQGMIMHHGQAVEMTAMIPARTESSQVRALGSRISASQTDEIRLMSHWLEARRQPTSMAMPGMPEMDMAGNPLPLMPGMLTPQQMVTLRSARGAEFDSLFLRGMIQHHTGALTMVGELFNAPGAGQDADLFNFATDVDNTQRAEIRIMRNLLQAPTVKDNKEK